MVEVCKDEAYIGGQRPAPGAVVVVVVVIIVVAVIIFVVVVVAVVVAGVELVLEGFSKFPVKKFNNVSP